MLRRTMQIGDKLHVGNQIVILEEITPGRTKVAIIEKNQPFVLRRNSKGTSVTTIEQREDVIEAPYHPEVETMLKG